MLGITAAQREPLPDYSAGSGPVQRRFSPYNDNGGSTVAIAGKISFKLSFGKTRQIAMRIVKL